MESAQFNALVAQAVGQDDALAREIRASVVAGVRGHADLMRRSRCDANWVMASRRLKGLAESFGLDELVALADVAIEGAPGDPRVLLDIERHLADF